MSKFSHLVHNLNPIISKESTILILGSFPSKISREDGFYYANKMNRFWKVIYRIYNVNYIEENLTVSKKKEIILKNKLALFDIVKSCLISNSSDSSIKDVKYNDIVNLIKDCKIKYIIANGNKAYELIEKYQKEIGSNFLPPIIKLPSTSSANSKISLDKLVEEYSKYLFRN